jgi:succinyl-CoA synthetase beta subunit
LIRLNGNIGLISNGAGNAMATMDHLSNIGGEVSAFVDIGGHTFHEQISYVITLLSEDTKTAVIFFNCFDDM